MRMEMGSLETYINEGKPTMSTRQVDSRRKVRTSDIVVQLRKNRNFIWNSKRTSPGGRTTQKNGKITPPPKKVALGRARPPPPPLPTASKPRMLMLLFYMAFEVEILFLARNNCIWEIRNWSRVQPCFRLPSVGQLGCRWKTEITSLPLRRARRARERSF